MFSTNVFPNHFAMSLLEPFGRQAVPLLPVICVPSGSPPPSLGLTRILLNILSFPSFSVSRLCSLIAG